MGKKLQSLKSECLPFDTISNKLVEHFLVVREVHNLLVKIIPSSYGPKGYQHFETDFMSVYEAAQTQLVVACQQRSEIEAIGNLKDFFDACFFSLRRVCEIENRVSGIEIKGVGTATSIHSAIEKITYYIYWFAGCLGLGTHRLGSARDYEEESFKGMNMYGLKMYLQNPGFAWRKQFEVDWPKLARKEFANIPLDLLRRGLMRNHNRGEAIETTVAKPEIHELKPVSDEGILPSQLPEAATKNERVIATPHESPSCDSEIPEVFLEAIPNERPALRRDHYFRWLSEEKKLKGAGIRDTWNSLSNETRKQICPDQPDSFEKTDNERRRVVSATNNAKKEPKIP